LGAAVTGAFGLAVVATGFLAGAVAAGDEGEAASAFPRKSEELCWLTGRGVGSGMLNLEMHSLPRFPLEARYRGRDAAGHKSEYGV
jgi:hypothetical protein